MKNITRLLATVALLFGIVGGVSTVKAGNSYLEIKTNEIKANAWEWAIWYQLSTPLESGATYVLTMDAKCSETYDMAFWPSNTEEGGNTTYTGYTIGTEWSVCKCEFTTNDALNRLSWNFGSLNGTLCFDNVKLVKKGETTNLIEGGDFESGIHANWGNDGWNSPEYSICTVQGTPKKYLEMTTNSVKNNPWEWAIWYKLDTPLENGKTYVLSMKAKCSEAYNMPFWPYKDGGQTLYSGYNIGTEWGDCSCTFTANDDLEYLKWCFGSLNGTVCFDDVSLVEQGQTTNLINGGDFEDGLASNWGDDGWNKPDYRIIIEYPAVEVYSLEFDEYGSATTDKKYLIATDGLSYDAETGILTSDGTAGTMILEFAEPADLKYLKTFEVKRSGGNDGIMSRLKFYDEDGGVINTWSNSKLANSGLDNNATNAFINHKPVKKLVWESDENSDNNERSFTISGVNFQLKTISCSKAGETILNTLPWIKIEDSSTPTPTWNMNVSTDTYYGNTSSDATHYVDLTDYEELRIYRDNNDGFRAFFINAAGTATNTITGANATWNTKEKYWSIDLSTIEKWENKVALKSIKSASYGVYNIVKNIVVYKTPAANAPQYILAGSGMQLAETVAALADANATCIDATGVTGITTNSEAGQTLLESANPNCLFLGKVGIGYMSNTQNVIDGDACDNLVLTDAKPYKAPVAFTATAAKFMKTVSAAQYATMVIPFDASIPEGVQAFNLKSIDNETIGKSDPLASITANSPVMIKNEGTFDFTASNVAIAATDEGELDNYFLHGGYSTMNVAADDGNYVLQNNDNGVNFYLVTGTPATLKPFRAYLKAPSSARVLYIGLDDTTGLNNVKGKMEDLNGEVYNLQGQRFSQPTKGLYIVNGKKVIIK